MWMKAFGDGEWESEVPPPSGTPLRGFSGHISNHLYQEKCNNCTWPWSHLLCFSVVSILRFLKNLHKRVFLWWQTGFAIGFKPQLLARSVSATETFLEEASETSQNSGIPYHTVSSDRTFCQILVFFYAFSSNSKICTQKCIFRPFKIAW